MPVHGQVEVVGYLKGVPTVEIKAVQCYPCERPADYTNISIEYFIKEKLICDNCKEREVKRIQLQNNAYQKDGGQDE